MSECLQERTTEMPAIGRLSSSMIDGTLAASGTKQLHPLNRHNSSQRLMAMQYHKSIPVDGKPLTPQFLIGGKKKLKSLISSASQRENSIDAEAAGHRYAKLYQKMDKIQSSRSIVIQRGLIKILCYSSTEDG